MSLLFFFFTGIQLFGAYVHTLCCHENIDCKKENPINPITGNPHANKLDFSQHKLQ